MVKFKNSSIRFKFIFILITILEYLKCIIPGFNYKVLFIFKLIYKFIFRKNFFLIGFCIINLNHSTYLFSEK